MVHLTKLRCSHLSRRPQHHDEVCDVRFPLEDTSLGDNYSYVDPDEEGAFSFTSHCLR